MWYYQIDGQQEGPVSPDVLQEMCGDGTISDHTLVWREGMEDWTPLSAAAPELCAAVEPSATDESPYAAPGTNPTPRPAAGQAGVSPAAQGTATGSMICGIVALVLTLVQIGCCVIPVGAVIGVIALVLANQARKEMEETGDMRAQGMAKAGRICGIIAMIVSLLLLVAYVVFMVVMFALSAMNP